MKRSLALALTSLAFTVCAFGADRRQSVKIIDRHYSETAYSYYVPEHGEATSNGSFGCFGSGGNINCSGSQNSSAYAVGASMTAYSVTGATLALLLPDGRVAVVNCTSKYSLKFDYINARSCRFPLVNDIEAEFFGNKAKLQWQVSLDGKKVESETYNIVAVVGTTDSGVAKNDKRVSALPVNQGSGQRAEWDEYKAATASADPAAQENAANHFAEKFPESELRPLLYKAAMQRYQQANNSGKTAEIAKKVLAIDPDDPEALVALAHVEVDQTKEDNLDKDHRLAEAKKGAERALVTVDTDVPTAGYPEEQLKNYKNFIRSHAYFVIGMAAYKASNWPEAEANLKRSIDAFPQSPDVVAVYNLALSLDFQNKVPEALKVVQQAVDLTKDNPDSLAGKAARQERDRLLVYAPSIPAQAASAASVPSPNNSQSTSLADVMIWFDEPAPGLTTELREVVITARAYDGVLNILRKLRDSDTSVKSGSSVLETGYHPPSFRLGAFVPSKQSVQVFHWDDEVPTSDSLVMYIRVTRKVYDNVSNAIGHLHVTIFSGP